MEIITIISQISQIFIAIGTLGGVVGVWLAYASLKANHDWNRRHLAIEKILDIQRALKEYRDNEFEYKLHYSNRKLSEPYKVEELHLLMCKKNETSNILEWDNNKHCILTKEGRILCNQIATFLDTYEIVAGGVLQNTFDEKIVKNLLGGSMTKAYTLFSDYIQHLREHYNRPKLYIELENLVKKWKAEENLPMRKREPTA